MTRQSDLHKNTGATARVLGCALALWLGSMPSGVRAQQPVAPPAAATGSGWYGYVPGRGWVVYAPPSSPAPGAAPAAPRAPLPSPPPGWAGYAPATAWTGYAPASAPISPAVRPQYRRVYPPGPLRRSAANLAVNHIAPGLSYAIPSYREYGTGRNVPLAKPWLPPSP